MRMTPLISPAQGQPKTCCHSRQANNLVSLQSFFKGFQPRTGLAIILRVMSKWLMAMERLLKIKNTFIHHITATFYNTKQNSLCSPAIILNRNNILHNFCGKIPSLRFQVGKDGRLSVQKTGINSTDMCKRSTGQHLDRKTKMLL